MRERIILIILSVLILTLLVVDPEVVLTAKKALVGSASNNPATDIAVEKDSRAAAAAWFTYLNAELGQTPASGVRAMAFSNYPFNLKDQLTLAAGTNAGVALGQAVILPTSPTVPMGVLVGKISAVYSDASVATTLFDTNWSSAVRIGDRGVEALLTGGLEPELSLIPKDAAVAPGDIVYSADAAFPFGLALGRIRSVELAKDRTFQRAKLTLAYDISLVKAAVIVRSNGSTASH